LPKRGGVSAFAEGWATAKEGEARARARRALRPVSPEDTAEIKGLPDTYPRRVKQDVDPRP